MQPRPVDVGARKQLFLDDYVIDSMQEAQRQLHRPVRYAGNPVIQADRPWETGGGTYLFGGTVLYDEEDRIFKMWYRSSAPLEVSDEKGGYRAVIRKEKVGTRPATPSPRTVSTGRSRTSG